jgi:hypothetical protein
VVGARTSNASLKKLCAQSTVDGLIRLTSADKRHSAKDRCIAFQTDIQVVDGADSAKLRPRTLEEAIVYENFGLFRAGTLSIGVEILKPLQDAYECVYKRIQSNDFKKTDFAMDILACAEELIVPNYIAEGLHWLEERLCPPRTTTVSLGAATTEAA